MVFPLNLPSSSLKTVDSKFSSKNIDAKGKLTISFVFNLEIKAKTASNTGIIDKITEITINCGKFLIAKISTRFHKVDRGHCIYEVNKVLIFVSN